MTTQELEIAQELARRFPSSAQATGGRKLRVRISTAFPHIDRRIPDTYESFLEAAESLEAQGIVSLSWAGRVQGEELLAITLCDQEALFSQIGKLSPRAICDSLRTLAKDLARGRRQDFFQWAGESLLPKDIDSETGEPSTISLQNLALLTDTLELITSGNHPSVLPRALSVELFSDSKHIEFLLRVFQPLFRKAERAGIALPPFDLVDRSFPETLVAGELLFSGKISTDGSKPIFLDNNSGFIIGLPFETIIRMKSVVSVQTRAPGKVLGVENKETFYALAAQDGTGIKGFDAVIYVGGHPNRAVQSLFRLFHTSGWALFHTGDLDPDGILILQELSDAAGTPVHPWFMSADIFYQYRNQARNLDSGMHLRALRIREETLRIPGIKDLLDAILNSGLGVEQEIITY